MPHKFDGYCSFARSHLAAMERTAAAQKTPAVTVSVLAAEGFFPEWLQKLAFCPHGVLAGKYRSRCERCVREQKEIEEKHRREQELLERQQRIERERQEREQRIDAAAASLQRRERLRLATSLIPSIEELQRLSWQQFENEVAGMFERMGYKVQQTPPVKDHGRDGILLKNGEKFLYECKRYAEGALSGRRDLQNTSIEHYF
jgi:hypothetical protein